jgi:hypothetical protein
MIGNRICAFALSIAFAIICSALPAMAAHFDGNWSMLAVTISGHCGSIPIGLGISHGRVYSTGGGFAGHPIQLAGRISAWAGPNECGSWTTQRPGNGTVQSVSRKRDVGRYWALRSLLRRLERHSLLSERGLTAEQLFPDSHCPAELSRLVVSCLPGLG